MPELAAAELRLSATSGGQSNPTWFLHFGARKLVLRKQPPGELAPSAHAVDGEYRIHSALQGSAVRVPRPLLYCDDRAVIGTLFYVMECVGGTVEPEASLPGRSPEERRAIYLSAATTLGSLHALDWRAAGLGDYGRAGAIFERQLARWTRFWREQGLGDNADLDAVVGWLEANFFPGQLDSWSAVTSILGFRFLRFPGQAFIDWHPEVVNNLAIFLSGDMEIEIGGGASDGAPVPIDHFLAGDVLLAADRTGEGHIDRMHGNIHLALIVIEDQHLWPTEN